MLANRDDDRLAATSVLVSFPGDFLETPTTFSEYPSELTLADEPMGLAEPPYRASGAFFSAAYDGLTATGHAFVLSDTGRGAHRGLATVVACSSSARRLCSVIASVRSR